MKDLYVDLQGCSKHPEIDAEFGGVFRTAWNIMELSSFLTQQLCTERRKIEEGEGGR